VRRAFAALELERVLRSATAARAAATGSQ
jgi:hypothetical protein